MIRVEKIVGLEKDLAIAFPDTFSPEARSRYVADFARTELAIVEEHNARAIGRVPPHETYVDGRKGASLNSVKPDGVIVFEFELLEEIFTWIAEQLFIHSPWLTGRFARSFVFFADGREADPSGPVPAAEEYFFVNLQPYARRIERGWSPQSPGPPGLMESLAKMASGRFGNIANVTFAYRTPIFGAIHGWANRTSMQSSRRSDRAEWLRRQPAIVIRSRG